MHRSEAEGLTPCGACGAEIAPGCERSYGVTAELEICNACAIARHGVYDEAHDRWLRAPDVGDLTPLLHEGGGG